MTVTSSSEEAAAAVAEVPKGGSLAVQAEMSKDDYETLIKAAAEAGLTPSEFLVKSIQEGAFIARERRKGNRILVQSSRGVRELVD